MLVWFQKPPHLIHMITKKEKVDWTSTDRRKPDVMASLFQMVLLTLLEGENLIRKIP